ncbi:MAG: hypothetical protein H6582_00970 [Crocinitomicaceae bacterium]|nr:hypothetical protein [Crocinitomicaceae bacterium]
MKIKFIFSIIAMLLFHLSSSAQDGNCRFVLELYDSLEQNQEFKLSMYSFHGLSKRQENKARKRIDLYRGKQMTNSTEYFQKELNSICYLHKMKFANVKKYTILTQIHLIPDTLENNMYILRLEYTNVKRTISNERKKE